MIILLFLIVVIIFQSLALIGHERRLRLLENQEHLRVNQEGRSDWLSLDSKFNIFKEANYKGLSSLYCCNWLSGSSALLFFYLFFHI